MRLERREAVAQQLAAAVGYDAYVEAAHPSPSGRQSWIETTRRIGNSP